MLKKNLHARGTQLRAAHFVSVTAETPPPVQAAGDTIPKGLRSSERRPFFLIPRFGEGDPANHGGGVRRQRCAWRIAPPSPAFARHHLPVPGRNSYQEIALRSRANSPGLAPLASAAASCRGS